MRLLAFFLGLGLSVVGGVNFAAVYDWGELELDYSWPSQGSRSKAIADGTFDPEIIKPRFMAVYKDRVFLSLAKYDGIPVTFVSLPTGNANSAPPKLTPFPSWNFYENAGCDSINEARGVEVDSAGRLWLLDDGSASCKAKLWIFSLDNNDKVELVHRFGENVVSPHYGDTTPPGDGEFRRGRKMWDLALDETPDDTLAYVTDAESEHVIAFSLKRKQSWPLKTPGKRFSSVALSPAGEPRRLYLSTTFYSQLHSASASELRQQSENAVLTLTLVGEWDRAPHRMLIDDANVLLATTSYNGYISWFNISSPFNERRLHEAAPFQIFWPFTLARDAAGSLWLTERNETGQVPRHKLLKASRYSIPSGLD